LPLGSTDRIHYNNLGVLTDRTLAVHVDRGTPRHARCSWSTSTRTAGSTWRRQDAPRSCWGI